MAKFRKTICVDFDGVINTYEGWNGEEELYNPRDGAAEFLGWLGEKYRVCIYSTRSADSIYEWLNIHGLLSLVDDVSNSKPRAVAYIDDRGFRFNGCFNEMKNLIENEIETHWERAKKS